MVLRCKLILHTGFAALGIGAMALAGTPVRAAAPRVTATLGGAGSTFIAPLMTGQWIPDYTKAHAGVQISYAAGGSGAGLKSWIGGQADFAASDAQLTAAQEGSARRRCGATAVKIPATISAVALIYNVPGVRSGLKLSPTVVAGIFLGQITSWNDAAIQRINPGVRLPHLVVKTVHRLGGSGTTFILTSYLADVNARWRGTVGAKPEVNWPTGSGVKGSAGVVQNVSVTLGAVGYVDLAYAIQDTLDYARIQNAAGLFVTPNVDAASSAADSEASSMPHDLQQVIVNAPAPGAYPITGYSYIMLCSRQTGAKGQALVDFVRYAVTTGQTQVKKLHYAPLPPSVQRLDTAALDHISS